MSEAHDDRKSKLFWKLLTKKKYTIVLIPRPVPLAQNCIEKNGKKKLNNIAKQLLNIVDKKKC